jgi:hypothetical protein
MAEVTPRTEHQTYQGTRSTAERTLADAVVTEEIEVVVDAMLSLCSSLIIALLGRIRDAETVKKRLSTFVLDLLGAFRPAMPRRHPRCTINAEENAAYR